MGEPDEAVVSHHGARSAARRFQLQAKAGRPEPGAGMQTSLAATEPSEARVLRGPARNRSRKRSGAQQPLRRRESPFRSAAGHPSCTSWGQRRTTLPSQLAAEGRAPGAQRLRRVRPATPAPAHGSRGTCAEGWPPPRRPGRSRRREPRPA